MEFTNEFVVATGAATAWTVLTDVPRIAPCLPGATVEPLGDDTYDGTVSVKVGPIKVSYGGTATFRELDQGAMRMVLDAQGQEKTGKGSAAAIVTVTLRGEGDDKTRVEVHTNLQITGKLAQFGRSAMADVGARLIEQFAQNLENLLLTDDDGYTEPRPIGASDSRPRTRPNREPSGQPAGAELDALALITPLLKPAVPIIAAFVGGVIVTWLVNRLRTPRDTTQSTVNYRAAYPFPVDRPM